jgi:DNA polymerase (family 10)
MELKQAQEIAEMVKTKLSLCCDRIEIAGSIRRLRPFVHDIDIVLVPANQGQLAYRLQQLGTTKAKGVKIIRIDPSRYGVSLDIYMATPETWATLLLIRTGSKAHNIRLCSLARRKGLILHADGRGLVHPGDGEIALESPVPCDTEESIFQELGLAYVPPEKRE